ncbi:MAG: S8 family serine peptidase [Thermodesulfobacteriota bacterium]
MHFNERSETDRDMMSAPWRKTLFLGIGKQLVIGLVFTFFLACGSDDSSSTTAQNPNSPPTARIISPADGSTYKQGDSIQFTGEASDKENGTLSGASLVWTSDRDGQLGTGTNLTTTALTAGTHQITLTATDTGNAAGSAVITVIVTPLFHISGTISTAGRNAVDGDTNDPNEDYTPNNTLAAAQQLPNPATVSGFLTKSPTGGGSSGDDRFAHRSDRSDYFRITLVAGQLIYLQIADWLVQDVTANDLDLYLVDNNGNTISSEGTGRAEEIAVSQSGEFYIVVYAFEGASNYVLNVSDAGSQADISGERLNVADDFIIGQALVKFRAGITGKTAGSRANLADASTDSLGLRRVTDLPGRANLMAFDIDRKASRLETGATGSHSIVQDLQTAGFELAPEITAKLATIERIKGLRKEPGVEFAEPNRIRRPVLTPNDRFYSQQWDFPAIQVPDAWDIADGSGVIVAVIDSGVYLLHEDLSPQLVAGYDFVSDPAASGDGDGIDGNPDDPGDSDTIGSSTFHGTHVAGTIAARTNNTVGVAGIAFGAKIMPLRALGPAGGTDADIAQCIYYSAGLANISGTVPSQRADIINMSLGGPGASQTLREAINAARNAGLIVIAAAGNNNSDEFFSPADEEGVIAVSAVGQNGTKASYSNYGPHIDVAAPGGDFTNDPGILSTSAKDGGTGLRASAYKALQGTSMAAPHMAGVAALMKSVHPAMTPAELDALLAENNPDLKITNDIGAAGRDDLYGYGLIDALRAVSAAQRLGGGEGVPGYLSLNPSTYDFGVTNELVVTVSTSDDAIRVVQVVENASWLSVTTQDVKENGTGTYLLQIDRTGLTPARYSATVAFAADNGNQSELQIYMTVLQSDTHAVGNLGLIYVLLLDEGATQSLYEVSAARDGDGYHFRIDGIAAGNYRLIAGTDHDNDYLVCDAGEGCGAFPTMDNTTLISLTQDLDDLEFLVHPDTQMVEKNATVMKSSPGRSQKPTVNQTQSPKSLP